MTAIVKLGIVLAGYVAAGLIAMVALAACIAASPTGTGDDGMRAFGESLVFLAVLALASLPATMAALYFLRPYETAWRALSVLAIAIATTGALAAGAYALGRTGAASLMMPASIGVLRLMVSPAVALAIGLMALLAPNWSSRRTLLTALSVEGLSMLLGALTLLGPHSF